MDKLAANQQTRHFIGGENGLQTAKSQKGQRGNLLGFRPFFPGREEQLIGPSFLPPMQREGTRGPIKLPDDKVAPLWPSLVGVLSQNSLNLQNQAPPAF